MRNYFYLVNEPDHQKCINTFIKSLNCKWMLPDFVVVEAEETALFIKKNVKDILYCDQVPDLMEALISSKSVCTTNKIFLEAIEELKPFANRKEFFNHSIIINDRLPWLKTLPNGRYEVTVDPVFLEPFQYYATVMTDDDNNAVFQKYCQITEIIQRDRGPFYVG